MFTSDHAPMASKNVHRSVGCIRDAGITVEKRDSASGDYRISVSSGTSVQSSCIRTCLNDPPEYGSIPWRNR